VHNAALFAAVAAHAGPQLGALQLAELPRVHLKFQTCAAFCEQRTGRLPAWWGDLQEGMAVAAASKCARESLESVYKVADIVVAEGISPQVPWVAALRPPPGPPGSPHYGAKWLAKCARTLRWAGVPADGMLEAAVASATAQAARLRNPAELADTALQFSCAGVADAALFDTIASAAADSCGAIRKGGLLVRLTSKLAAAGLDSPALGAALLARAEELGVAGEPPLVELAATGQLSLCADHALVAAWNVARTIPPAAALAKTAPPDQLLGRDGNFDDPTAPLALDIGCGYGGFVLRMAREPPPAGEPPFNWMGVDSLPPLICRAQGVARRWGIQGRTQFVHADAVEAVDWVARSYPGPLHLVCIQFPTPFQSKESRAGRGGADGEAEGEEPPAAVHGKGRFMVDARLAAGVAGGLSPGGRLLLQSNVAEVATAMAAQFERIGGFEAEPFRAEDFPGKTETEAACSQAGKPVHRVVLRRRR